MQLNLEKSLEVEQLPEVTLIEILKNIESNNITQTDEYDIYEVYEVNERGYKNKLIGYFNAISKLHARIRASLLKSNIEILITGFYDATLLSEQNIENILTKITLPGSIFLAIVAILPTFVTKIFGITSTFAGFFGGTSLLIIIGVGLDTLQQIESHLMMRHYDGFMKSGKLRGRSNY